MLHIPTYGGLCVLVRVEIMHTSKLKSGTFEKNSLSTINPPVEIEPMAYAFAMPVQTVQCFATRLRR